MRVPISSAIGERDDFVTLGDEVSGNSSPKKTTSTGNCNVFGYHYRETSGEGNMKGGKRI